MKTVASQFIEILAGAGAKRIIASPVGALLLIAAALGTSAPVQRRCPRARLVDEQTFDRVVGPANMVKPHVAEAV